MGMKWMATLGLPGLVAVGLGVQTQADAPTEAQVVEAAQAQASAACPEYTVERGNAGIAAVPVAALRVLARHRVVLCPDGRIKGEMAVIWYPKVGVFAWTPGDPAVVKTLAEIVDRIARLDDFPEAITVWDAMDEEFKLKEGYARPE
jgi:hypothetical protein